MTKRLLDVIKADVALLRPKPKNWFDRLSQDDQQELVAIRSEWRDGLIACSGKQLARLIVERFRERGVSTCGHDGVRAWLSKD